MELEKKHDMKTQTSVTISHLLHPPPSDAYEDSSPAANTAREGVAASSACGHISLQTFDIYLKDLWQMTLAANIQPTLV